MGENMRLRAVRAHGWAEVERWICDGDAESVHLEFKGRTRQGREADPGKLEAEDKGLIAKTISGFANTEGGLLVLGLDTQKAGKGSPERPLPMELQPLLKDARAFESAIKNGWRDLLTPHVAGVEVLAVLKGDGPEGVVCIHVPQSLAAPHRAASCAGTSVADRYFMRTESHTEAMPHGLLAALFGRRPQPALRLLAQWWNPQGQQHEIIMWILNVGPGAARHASVMFDRKTTEQFTDRAYSKGWSERWSPEGRVCVMNPSLDELVYPSGHRARLPNFVPHGDIVQSRSMRLTGTIYCEEAPPVHFDEFVQFRGDSEVVLPTSPSEGW